MLRPEPMREVNLFVFDQDVEGVADALARLEALHPEDARSESWAPAPEWAAMLDRYQNVLQRLDDLMAALELGRKETPPPEHLHPTVDLEQLSSPLREMEEQVSNWQQQWKNTQKEIARLELACSQIQMLLPLEVSLGELRGFRHQHLVVGTLPTENLERVGAALFQITFMLIPLDRTDDRTVILAASSQEHAAVLDRALKSAFFEPMELPAEAAGPPQEALSLLQERLRQNRELLRSLARERQRLAECLGPQLQQLRAMAGANARLAEAIHHFSRHGNVYLIVGWVPARRLVSLRQAAEQAARNRVVMEVLSPDPARREIPTLLGPPRWLAPFQPLVTTFGLSAYNELDPTLVATLSFLLMYGMMFGDLGHGILLALAGLVLWKRKAVFGVMVFAAGASGTLFGLLYGTAFGKQVIAPLWMRPLGSITALLVAAVIGGVCLLNLGFVLNLVNAWRNKDWTRFSLDKNGLVGILLYWSLLGGGLAVYRDVLPVSLWLIPVAVLSLMLWSRQLVLQGISGDHRPPVGEAILTGFFELFEAVLAYASNSLSFVRLGAFAVAHEGLGHMILSYSSGPAGSIVFLVGTVFLVGFEGFIVGIQALRLEYYEFFGRFFKGTGLPFVPISLRGASNAPVGIRI